MRISIVSTLLVACGLTLVACAANSDGVLTDDDQTMTADEAIGTASLKKQLPGDYKSDAYYPRFSLAKDNSYSFDSGIRCVRAPCPSGDVGTWSTYTRRGDSFVRLVSNDRKIERTLRVDAKKSTLLSLTGVSGITGVFKKIEKPATVKCDAVRCASGTFCDDTQGNAQCVPYATCAATKCAGGNYCVDRPIVCKKAPCAPTAPSCEACPAPGTWINCMPGPSAANPLCTAEMREKITLNCPDVGFAF